MKNRIKERRTELGMTQIELAKAVGVGQSTIADIEVGKHIPGVDIAIRIAQQLGIDMGDLKKIFDFD